MRSFRWIHYLAAIAATLLVSTEPVALGFLENPGDGGFASGVAAITGWHCTSKNIEVRIDGASLGFAGAGTSRLDTTNACGGHSDTGFSLLYNYSLLRGGTHRVDVYADGALFDTATFQSGYLGSEFLRGLSSAHRVTDFPSKGLGARVVWQESTQNFVIVGAEALTSGSLVGTYTVSNMWVQNSSGVVASTLAGNFLVSGAMTFTSGGTLSLNATMTGNGQSLPYVYSGPYSDGGYYINDNGAIDLIIERGDTLTITNLSVSGGVWLSTVISATKNLAKETVEEVAAGTMLPYGRSVVQAIGREALAQ